MLEKALFWRIDSIDKSSGLPSRLFIPFRKKSIIENLLLMANTFPILKVASIEGMVSLKNKFYFMVVIDKLSTYETF